MTLDIFRIVRIYMATGKVLVLMRAGGLVVYFIPSRAKTMIFLLNNISDEVLASLADQWLIGKVKSRLVILP
jgi:uncharacterized protein YjeT (DUF2065 family)